MYEGDVPIAVRPSTLRWVFTMHKSIFLFIFLANAWLHSGDPGAINSDGYIRITDKLQEFRMQEPPKEKAGTGRKS